MADNISIGVGPIHVIFDRTSIVGVVVAGAEIATNVADFMERAKITFNKPTDLNKPKKEAKQVEALAYW